MMHLSRILFAAVVIAGCAAGSTAGGAVRAAATTPARPATAAATVPSTDSALPAEVPAAEDVTATDSSLGAEASGAPAGQPVFHIQMWDGHKTNWDDGKLADLAASGFTVVQNGWNGSLFPSAGTVAKIARHGLVYGLYIDTRRLFLADATSQEKAAVRWATDPAGTKSKSEFNTFDPTYQAAVQEAMAKELARLAQAGGLYKVMLNSEHGSPISYDDLTVAEAIKAGAMTAGQGIPTYNRGVATSATLSGGAKFADPYVFLRWFGRYGGDRAINGVTADAARAARPGILATTDPLSDGYSYGQYERMDILQDWVRVHQAPRDPLSIAYRAERLKAHKRHQGAGEIWIGPQLGTKTSSGKAYAAPADEFEEALWLAVAFGARGITCWGYDTVRRGNPLDDDTWGRVAKFRGKLLADFPEILRSTDAPRACAVLLSKANQVYSTRSYHEIDDNYEHFYRILLTAHVPADVIYDDDVFEGRLARYKAVFLPGIEHLTPELEKAVGDFEKAGGRVIRWRFLSPRYMDYNIAKGETKEDLDLEHAGLTTFLPHQYRAWRQLNGARVFAEVADLMDVRVDNPDVILNVVEAGGKRFAVLVNDSRTYGAWTKEIGHQVCEDAGRPAEATVTIGQGDTARTVKVPLPLAGVAMMEVTP